jgi:hypothetical protein
MCVPVAAALAIGAAAVSATGQVIGGVVAKQQANFEAQVAQQNAAIERENIQMEQERGNREALTLYRRAAQLKGQQVATAAANGVSTDFGTASNLISDTDMLVGEDIANIYGQNFQNVRGMDRTVSNFKGEASAARARGKGAMTGALFGAAGTLLGGASQAMKLSAPPSGGSSGLVTTNSSKGLSTQTGFRNAARNYGNA